MRRWRNYTLGTALVSLAVLGAACGSGGGGNDGDSVFLRNSGAAVTAPRTTRLAQGSLEASNVDLSEAMTSMIEAQRGFELASKAIEVQDQMLQIANQVKR